MEKFTRKKTEIVIIEDQEFDNVKFTVINNDWISENHILSNILFINFIKNKFKEKKHYFFLIYDNSRWAIYYNEFQKKFNFLKERKDYLLIK